MARKIGSRYTAERVLGRGSAGTVWLGDGPEGPVAIKLLREDLASDQELVGRFVQERTALLSLDHPRIVGIRDLVVDGCDLALVMDLVAGCDLRSRLERDRRLAPATAVAIAADVADALAAAHAAGVVHRDVKPENVLLDTAAPAGPGDAPPALLTDFGIARLVDSPRRTRATRIIGTPDYLAPEIIEGLPPRASVDIYALATVLYELLAGFTPFGGGHPGAVLRRHVTETVTPIPGLPTALWQPLAQCLAKAPASRLTAVELGQRLRDLLPQLAGLPPLEIASPDDDQDDDDSDDVRDTGRPPAGHPADRDPAARPGAARDTAAAPAVRRGAVPLVRAAAPDSSRETHTSIKLPSAEELAAYPGARRTDGAPRPPADDEGRHRAEPEPVPRRRRFKLVAAAAAAVVAAGIGGWAVAGGSDDGKSSSREDHEPPGDHAHDSATPTAPTADAPAPQGNMGTPAAAVLPHWSAFRSVPRAPVALTGGPRAVRVSGATYVFARGADQNIWYVGWNQKADRYTSWVRLTGIHVKGDPAVVSARPGTIDLFAVGTDGLLYRRTLTAGGWGQWFQVDERTKFDAAPAAASSAPGRIDLVGRTGGDLVTASLVDGRWNAWAVVPTPGRITAAPALVSRHADTLDAFVVRASDGAVLHLPFANGAWRPTQVVGRLDADGRPEAVGAGDRIYVVAPAPTGGLAQAVYGDPGWTPAAAPSAGRSGRPVALLADGAELQAWTTTASGALAHATAAAPAS
ncbi:protein kinase domain-containing protein [Streptantibioticus silvisoli]|uniref:protein kinase domain-containing protein n=1 Tax=Streptantibioticus silvisoli TaxID=2705255 RepID=UPI0027E2C329|nr:protein kinase [Streptantibioticus silvisoli]